MTIKTNKQIRILPWGRYNNAIIQDTVRKRTFYDMKTHIYKDINGEHVITSNVGYHFSRYYVTHVMWSFIFLTSSGDSDIISQ